MTRETHWAIKGSSGLYYGTWRTRKEAIANHVWAMDQDCYDKGAPMSWRPLDADQKRAWVECSKRGDKAVKVRVTVIEPTP